MSKKVLLIWDRLGDYHRARVKALEELGADVYTADLGAADQLYQWQNSGGVKHIVLSELPVEKSDSRGRVARAKAYIDQIRPDILACPYGRSEYHSILAYARKKKIKTVIFCESWYTGGKLKDTLKSWYLRWLGNYMFVSGKRAYKHVVDVLKFPITRIVEGYSVVDNRHFESVIPLQNRPKTLLCIARFSEEKNLLRLIEAFQKSRLSQSWKLKIIGAGPLQSLIQQAVEGNSSIEIQAWCSYQELPKEYVQAKAFILPSSFEPWGLVVNEAIAAGLPVLLSSEVGALNDVYSSSMDKLVFVPFSTDAIRYSLDVLADMEDKHLQQVWNSQQKVLTTHNPEVWAQTLLKL
ncbi:MAG: glycosyltransferase family 4 protein [Cytophagaceae bacterium]